MIKILVLGKYPGGFIASNVMEYFKGNKVIQLLYSNSIDLRKREEVERFFLSMKPDVVVHAAAVTSGVIDIMQRPWIHINDNALINSNVLEASHKAGVQHFIFMSCCVMYNRKSVHPQAEDFLISPNNIETDYLGVASMKLFTESLCKFYSNKYGIKTTCIRHTNTFGPFDHFEAYNSHVFAALLEKIITTDGEIGIWGNPTMEKNFIYVKDVCRFIDFVIRNQKNIFEIYNLGGKNISLIDLVELMKEVTDHTHIKVVVKTKDIPKPFTPLVSFEKVRGLRWQPKYTLKKGIKETYQWRIKQLAGV